MEIRDRTIRVPVNGDKKKARQLLLMNIAVMSGICVAWFFAARAIGKPLVLPDFVATMKEFFTGWFNKKIMRNSELIIENGSDK